MRPDGAGGYRVRRVSVLARTIGGLVQTAFGLFLIFFAWALLDDQSWAWSLVGRLGELFQ